MKHLLTIAYCSALLIGCHRGESLGKVAGQVTFQGQPVTEGQIMFINRELGVYMTADLGVDGTYEVVCAHGTGLPPGAYQVAITPPPPDLPLRSHVPRPRKSSYPEIPAKYHDPNTSGLSLVVKVEGSQFNVDMQP